MNTWIRTAAKKVWRYHTVKTETDNEYHEETIHWAARDYIYAQLQEVDGVHWVWGVSCGPQTNGTWLVAVNGVCKTESGAKAAVKREVTKICAARGIKL